MANNNAVTASFQQYFKQHAAQESAPYISVSSDKVKADTNFSDHALWTVEYLPKGVVALRGHNGHYLSLNHHGQFHMAGSRTNEAHFHFVKEELDHAGCVAIKEPHGGFLAFDAHGHLTVKKGLSETENPAGLPFFKMDEKKTAHKEQHHGHHHHH